MQPEASSSMKPETAETHDEARDLETCRALLAAGSKSFALAARLLPTRVRDATTVIYAFCRIADDAVDSDPDASLDTVCALRERLVRVYEGRPDAHAVDRALSRVVRKERVPMPLLEALLEGFVWDLEARRYETLDEVHAYAARVAGTVGAIMTILMGPREANVVARACDLGVAMQLTNIARDVGEDAARGRLYLPAAWLRDEGVDPDAFLARPEASPAVRRVIARLLAHADELYRRADEGISCLPRDVRTSIRAARLIYADIGRVIAARGFDSVTRRAVVSKPRKLWLLVRALGARFWTRRLAEAPPLEPTRFLVAACAEAP